MGGTLFTKPTATQAALYCPRLPWELYNALKSHITAILLQHFEHVAVPHEAPEKQDHGDIDFLLASPRYAKFQPFSQSHIKELTQSLSAVRAEARGGCSWSFAVSVPELDTIDNNITTHAFAQIDLGLVPTVERLNWQMLTHSYGDLFQILGVLLRPLGLIFLPDGFAARISHRVFTPDQGDPYTHSTFSRTLLLSSDPDKVLSFLGLSSTKWNQGFTSLDDIYSYVASGRFFNRRTFEKATQNDDDETPHEATAHRLGSEEWTTKQKSRDKRRQRLRPMYRTFVEEWLPEHPGVGNDLNYEIPYGDMDAMFKMRMRALDEAVRFFGKGKEYDELISVLQEKQNEAMLWAAIRQGIPVTGERLGCAIRGLKNWVGFDIEEVVLVRENGEVRTMKRPPVVRSKPVKKGGKQPVWTKESRLSRPELVAWALKHWQVCKKFEREREKRAEEEKEREKAAAKKKSANNAETVLSQ